MRNGKINQLGGMFGGRGQFPHSAINFYNKKNAGSLSVSQSHENSDLELDSVKEYNTIEENTYTIDSKPEEK